MIINNWERPESEGRLAQDRKYDSCMMQIGDCLDDIRRISTQAYEEVAKQPQIQTFISAFRCKGIDNTYYSFLHHPIYDAPHYVKNQFQSAFDVAVMNSLHTAEKEQQQRDEVEGKVVGENCNEPSPREDKTKTPPPVRPRARTPCGSLDSDTPGLELLLDSSGYLINEEEDEDQVDDKDKNKVNDKDKNKVEDKDKNKVDDDDQVDDEDKVDDEEQRAAARRSKQEIGDESSDDVVVLSTGAVLPSGIPAEEKDDDNVNGNDDAGEDDLPAYLDDGSEFDVPVTLASSCRTRSLSRKRTVKLFVSLFWCV